MNHTAYDFRLVANNVNRAAFQEVIDRIEAAAAEGMYKTVIDVKQHKLKPEQALNLEGYLVNIGFDVTYESTEKKMMVSWLDKEKKTK